MNVVIVCGALSRAAEQRTLPSGDQLVAFEVTVRPADGPAESVPVTWFEAPARALTYGSGQEVVVVGRVRRRFFRTPAGTGSRTEVVAASVLPASHRSRVRKSVERALAEASGLVA